VSASFCLERALICIQLSVVPFLQGRITLLKTGASRAEMSVHEEVLELLRDWRSVTLYHSEHSDCLHGLWLRLHAIALVDLNKDGKVNLPVRGCPPTQLNVTSPSMWAQGREPLIQIQSRPRREALLSRRALQ